MVHNRVQEKHYYPCLWNILLQLSIVMLMHTEPQWWQSCTGHLVFHHRREFMISLETDALNNNSVIKFKCIEIWLAESIWLTIDLYECHYRNTMQYIVHCVITSYIFLHVICWCSCHSLDVRFKGCLQQTHKIRGDYVGKYWRITPAIWWSHLMIQG